MELQGILQVVPTRQVMSKLPLLNTASKEAQMQSSSHLHFPQLSKGNKGNQNHTLRSVGMTIHK